GTKAGLERFDDYQALVLEVVAKTPDEQLGDLSSLPSLWRFYRKGRRWRLEAGQYRYGSKWPTAPTPKADMHEWINGYARHFKFLPVAICDGTTIYDARLHRPEGARFQQVESWDAKRKVKLSRGVEDGRFHYSWAYRPEFYAYRTLPIGQHFDATVVVNPETGPENSILVECRSTRKSGSDANYQARYWVDPSHSFVAMRSEMGSGTVEPRPYIMEELAQTPRGLWYPTIMRWKVGRIRDGQPPVYDQIIHFYLDFKTEMPDSLFNADD
ncbi:MAG: hypothetical protein ACI93T_004690, partial [Porticoccaceae bacterium]